MGRNHNTAEQQEQAKERRREYMREYKRKQYETKRKEISEANKIHYLKTKKNLSTDEIDQFQVCKSEFGKILCLCKKINIDHPSELKSFLTNYLNQL